MLEKLGIHNSIEGLWVQKNLLLFIWLMRIHNKKIWFNIFWTLLKLSSTGQSSCGRGFDSPQECFCVRFACCQGVCVGLSSDMHWLADPWVWMLVFVPLCRITMYPTDIWLESLQHPRSAGEALMKNESPGSRSFWAVEIFPHAGSVISRSVSQLQRPLRPDPAVPHRAGRGRHHLLRDPAVLQGKDRHQGRERLGRVPPGTDEQFCTGSPSRSGFQSFSHPEPSPWSFCL